ncbi:MAG TPA: DUF4159 domain-containing protein, partial [Humisphaera sp.]
MPPRTATVPPGAAAPRSPDDGPPWDNSNAQLAVWAVFLGTDAGATVGGAYWDDVLGHWTRTDLPGGAWPYDERDRTGSLAMTAGGLASVLAAVERGGQASLAAKFTYQPNGGMPPEVAAALAWLAQGDRAVDVPGPRTRYAGYDLFALARAGFLGGYKYLGPHDWYRELAARAVAAQRDDGSWAVGGGSGPADADAVANTAFHVLFLSMGRHPVLVNKLQHPGAWNARPRDAANATRSVARSVERPLNWQVVPLDRPGPGWLDSPVLYVAANDAVRFADADLQHLRDYVRSGGMVFLHCDGGSGAANRFAADLATKLFPQYPLEKLPADHPLYTVVHKLRADAVPLKAVRNGSRVLLLVSPNDLAGAWQERAEKARPEPFQLMVNLYAYAHGKTGPRPRLQTYDVPAPNVAAAATIPVARLKWAGNWDPEPGAWGRAGRFLQWETGAAVDARPVAVADLKPGAAPVAHLTGTGTVSLDPAEAGAVRAFVEAGGVLLVDACGGDAAFRASVEQALAAALPGITLADADRKLAPFAPAFDVMDDLTGPAAVRPYVAQHLGGEAAGRVRVGHLGRGTVVYSPLDLTTGLAGSNAWGVAGYTPDYSVGLVKNVLVWAAAAAR